LGEEADKVRNYFGFGAGKPLYAAFFTCDFSRSATLRPAAVAERRATQ
jgi:hypothetical protein